MMNDRQNDKSSNRLTVDDGVALLGIFLKFAWWCLIYSPFLITAFLTGELLQHNTTWPLWLIILLSLTAAVLFYLLVNLTESFADRFKAEENLWYIPLKILVVFCVSGMPFMLGYHFVADWFTNADTSTGTQLLVGSIGGLLLGIPAYIQVIVKNKQGY